MLREARERILLAIFGTLTVLCGLLVLASNALPNALQIFGGLLLLSAGIALVFVVVLPDLGGKFSAHQLVRSERVSLLPIPVLASAGVYAGFVNHGLYAPFRILLVAMALFVVVVSLYMLLSGRMPLPEYLDDVRDRHPGRRVGTTTTAPEPVAAPIETPLTYEEG